MEEHNYYKFIVKRQSHNYAANTELMNKFLKIQILHKGRDSHQFLNHFSIHLHISVFEVL